MSEDAARFLREQAAMYEALARQSETLPETEGWRLVALVLCEVAEALEQAAKVTS